MAASMNHAGLITRRSGFKSNGGESGDRCRKMTISRRVMRMRLNEREPFSTGNIGPGMKLSIAGDRLTSVMSVADYPPISFQHQWDYGSWRKEPLISLLRVLSHSLPKLRVPRQAKHGLSQGLYVSRRHEYACFVADHIGNAADV